MKATASGVLVCMLVLALAATSLAGSSRGYRTFDVAPKMALHIVPHNGKQSCGNLPSISTFEDITRMQSGLADYDVFTVVFDYGTGFTAVEYALKWPTEWGSATTTGCGDFVIGDVVNPGDRLSMTWTECQTSPSFYVVAWSWLLPTSAGQVQLDFPSEEGAILGIADCDFNEIWATYLYFAGVDVDPWEGEPDPEHAVEATTWGNIKSMFR